jgi:MFS family permease
MSDSPAAAEQPYPSTAMAAYVVGTLTIAFILAFLDRSVLTLLTPFLKADLTLSDTQISLVQGLAFSMVFVLAGLPIGRLVDRSNRRNIIIGGVLVWSVCTVLCGLSENFWQLFSARMGVGVGEACLAPAAYSLLADYLRPNRRGLAMGVLTSGASVGTAGSNLLGGFLLNAMEGRSVVPFPLLGDLEVWRLAFVLFGAPGIVLALFMLTLREPERRETLKKAATGKLGQFLPYLVKNGRVYFSLYGAFALKTTVTTSFTVWGPIVFMRRYGMSPGDVGLMMGTTLLIVGIFAGMLGGHLSDMFQRKYPLDGRVRVGLITYPGVLACVCLFAIHSIPLSLAAYAGIKIFGAMTAAAATATLQDLSPNEMRGRTQALYVILGNVVGLSMGSTLIALVTDYVFRDENLVAYSMIVVGIPLMLISMALLAFAIGPSREMRRGIIALAAQSPTRAA